MSTITIENIKSDSNYSVMNYNLTEIQACYECRGLFVLEEDGQYSAHCLNLPGVQSQGETLEDAISHLNEAFAVAIETYLEMNADIPWEDISEEYREVIGVRKRTAVHVE